jgi:hypothetical protein
MLVAAAVAAVAAVAGGATSRVGLGVALKLGLAGQGQSETLCLRKGSWATCSELTLNILPVSPSRLGRRQGYSPLR